MKIKEFIYAQLLRNNKPITSRMRYEWFENNDLDSILNKIIERSSFLPDNSTVSERVYCIIHDINSMPCCHKCGNNLQFISYTKGYLTYCSKKCANQSTNNFAKHGRTKQANEKRRQTNRKKYGVDHAIASPEIRQKIQKKIKQKYNVDNIFQAEFVKNKIKHPIRSHWPVEILNKIDDIEFLKNEHHNKKKPTYQISKEIGVSESLVSKVLHKNNHF
jgi:hypothetical protein